MTQDTTYRLIEFCRDTYAALQENASTFLTNFIKPIWSVEIQGTTFEFSWFELCFGNLMIMLLTYIVIVFMIRLAELIPDKKP